MKKYIALLLCLVLACLPVTASAVSLETVQGEIEVAEEELEAFYASQRELTNEIDALMVKIDAMQNRLDNLDRQLSVLNTAIGEKETEIARLETSIAEREVLLERRINTIYKNQHVSDWNYLFRASSLQDLWNKLFYLSSISENDLQLMELQEAEKAALQAQREGLEQLRGNAAELSSRVQTAKAELEALKADKDEKLRRVVDNINDAELDLEELQAIEEQLKEELRRVEQEQQNSSNSGGNNNNNNSNNGSSGNAGNSGSTGSGNTGSSGGNSGSSGGSSGGGAYIWPVPGFYRITSEFGYRYHPVTGEWKGHKGIDVGSNWSVNQSIYGADFVAAAGGKVILARPYNSLTTGYGNCVMIDHGNGVVSLYAHGSAILVSEGDYVSQGQPVLRVGSTGVSTGAHAHFEIRVNGNAVDPLDYVPHGRYPLFYGSMLRHAAVFRACGGVAKFARSGYTYRSERG